ncbi:type II secretion system F family protein [Microvirga brassicacearum]|uniref:Type II secretion system F family protein n=1 Tax=Microvirga brassicacearum TaxID=2580413 RepID=A0A5N3P7Q6_9HYPH|nr:type II secretion system F family protein [Microvirga brassicacearum]KAB0265760.1 type II secretion system F family protein [Microvirga brassicacearum]
MLSLELVPVFAAALLAALCVGGVVIFVLYSRVGRRSEASRRFAAIANWDGPVGRAVGSEEGSRKRSIETTLRNLEEQQKARKGVKPSLAIRMRQAGLSWSKNTYFAASVLAAGFSFVIALVAFGVSPLPALGFGVAGGLLLPHLYVNRKRNGRFKAFTAEFPNAVDVIVRGVKAGLPLVDCLRMIASEAKEPVRSEFKAILDDQTVGVPMDQAVQRLSERIPVPEANFFAIVISLQSRSGGSLSEALGNLSRVLRERKKMAGKVRAMSSEAKASAGIIGSLPVVVTCLLYLSAPDYISLLFTTLVGKAVLVAAGIWMGFGVLIMRKMINFDI